MYADWLTTMFISEDRDLACTKNIENILYKQCRTISHGFAYCDITVINNLEDVQYLKSKRST